jgi:hypothetical protein
MRQLALRQSATDRRDVRVAANLASPRVLQLNPVNTVLIERPDVYPWAALPRTVEAARLLLKKNLVPFNKLLGY